jgi:hypothetical protein
MRISTTLLAAAAAVALAGPALAVTVTTATSGTTPAADPGYGSQTLLYDFDSLTPTAGNLFGNYTIYTAPGDSNSAAPSGTVAGTHFLSVPNPASNGTATILLGGTYKEASFYWGSIDDYNTVEVLGVGGAVLATYTGSQLPSPVSANGNQTGPISNMRVNFADNAGITGFRLTSTQFAFETDTYAVGAAVPEPATWAMLIAGFGLVGAASRRSRKSTTVVTA